jgi:hypothetical protein
MSWDESHTTIMSELYPNWSPTAMQLEEYMKEFSNTDEFYLRGAIKLYYRKSKYPTPPRPEALREKLQEYVEEDKKENGKGTGHKWYWVKFLNEKGYSEVMEVIDDREHALQIGEQVNGVVTEKWREDGMWKEKTLRKGVEFQWQLKKEEPKISTPNSTLSKNIGMIKKEMSKGTVQF